MDTQKLSPSARLTLDALKAGPGNVHELSDRTGRSRSTTDKAINDLAKTGLIVKVDDGGDPADGAPTRWQLAEAPADAETGQPEPDGGDNATEPAADTPATDTTDTTDADATTQAEAADPTADSQPDTDPPTTGDGEGTAPGGEATADGEATPDGGGQPDTEAKPDGEATQDGDEKKAEAEAEPPKLCRGCQTQMPKICQCCWQKTPAFCGKCRKDMPQVRRGEPGEPVILSNGLPKLRPGELEAMVEKVMREKPLPAFAGVTGWTGGRVAIHLPGRSTGAINNAMEKLERNGIAELIGDKPMRYKLKDAEHQQPDGETDSSQDTNPGTDDRAPAQDSQADGAQPPADAEAPQPAAAE
ncbi:hypothetical protein KIF24_17070 [Micromonospora sp. Llam7]|uniref:MarR family transcriptional regulator n=1 Tax=Micromonospora tarapacensis TaxID=2835305 RepID=UPI001C83FBFA|nr:MarR family transcriptional regulator [Micromonospora tarapacensis]MBX7267575.1 hypothetical protein [Micromonospora tarapacensis]